MSSTTINAILSKDGINTVFQPIFHVGGEVATLYAYEALSRGPAGTHFERADVLLSVRDSNYKKRGTPCLVRKF